MLRVAPDLLPPGRVKLTAVEIDGKPHADIDPEGLTVTLPDAASDLRVKATLTPVT